MADSSFEHRPDWIRSYLFGLAIHQWLIAFAIIFLLPDGWSSIMGLPPSIVKTVMNFGALFLTIMGFMLGFRPEDKDFKLFDRLAEGKHPIPRAAFIIACVLISVFFLQKSFLDSWIVYGLIAVQSLAFGLFAYLLSPPKDDKHFWTWFPVLLIIAGLGLRFWFMLEGFVWADEGYRLGTVANALKGGGLTPIMAYFPEGTDVTPWREYGFILYIWWARVFGLGLMQSRMLSYLLGVLTLPAIYAAIKGLYDQRTALVTTSFTALSLLFIRTAIARNDALPMLAFALVFLLHIYAVKKDRWWLYVLVGVGGGAALEGHLTNLIFYASAGGYYLFDTIQKARERGRWLIITPFCYFLAGSVIGLGYYYSLHVLFSPYSLGEIKDSISTGTPDQSLSTLSGFITWRLKVARFRFFDLWQFTPIESMLMLGSVVAAFLRREKSDLHWLAMMIFLQLGLILVEINGSVRHTLYGLAVLLGASGALVTRGIPAIKSKEHWQKISYVLIAVGLLSWDVALVQIYTADRAGWEDRHLSIVEYVQDNIPADAGIIAPPIYYSYLVEYDPYLHPNSPVADKGPALAGIEPNLYWMEILLTEWPVARIQAASNTKAPLAVHLSYMQARHAEEVIPGVWRVPDATLITDADYLRPDASIGLQMVAHTPLGVVQSGGMIHLDTIWVLRESIAGDYQIEFMLTDEEGKNFPLTTIDLISGWLGEGTSKWESGQFHDILINAELPEGITVGAYTLQISLSSESSCLPRCTYRIALEIRD